MTTEPFQERYHFSDPRHDADYSFETLAAAQAKADALGYCGPIHRTNRAVPACSKVRAEGQALAAPDDPIPF